MGRARRGVREVGRMRERDALCITALACAGGVKNESGVLVLSSFSTSGLGVLKGRRTKSRWLPVPTKDDARSTFRSCAGLLSNSSQLGSLRPQLRPAL